MTNQSLDINQLLELAKGELIKQQKGQEFLLGDVANITRQAYEKYIDDPVINQFAYVIEQMVDKRGNSALISQAEMTDVYNNLVRLSGNTKFRDVLGIFLLTHPTTKTASYPNDFVRMNRVDAENSQLSTNDFIDSKLADALSRAFGGKPETKAYNTKAAEIGKGYVEVELQAIGYKRPRVELIGGDAFTLVYAAHIDTPKGIVSVAIPIEMSSGKLLLPSVFVADDRFEELTAQKFQSFVERKSVNGDFSVPSVDGITKAVKMLTGIEKTASREEFSASLNSFEASEFKERGDMISLSTPELFSDKHSLPEPKPYIDTTAKAEMPKELAHLAHDFENDLLEAASAFGKNIVQAGKRMVLSELSATGFKNTQIRFGSEDSSSVIYLAAIHTPTGPVEIEIPVEMHVKADGTHTPLAPSYFAYDGLIEDFTPEKLQRFAIRRPQPSTGQKIYSTAHSYMTLPELRDEVVKAAMQKDYVSAEMILGTIQERFDEEAYKNAIADYHYILMHDNRVAGIEHSCSKPIKAGQGSIEARCGHFGVPMSKVVIGDDGQCRLRSHIEREKLNPLSEGGAAISSNKMFWS